jgi:putative hemolysin
MEFLILATLILLNGFFSLSEIAVVSSKTARLEQAKQSGNKGAAFALRLLGNSENFLSAVQVGITLVGIVTGLYGGMSLAKYFVPMFAYFDFLLPYADEIALIVTVVIITYISIVIGELVPKTIALSNPEKVACIAAPPVYYFSKVMFPFVKVLSVSTTFINNILGVKKANVQYTETELRQMLKTASHEGVIEKEQTYFHENIFYFADKKAKHLMTHRTEIEWIDLDETREEAHRTIEKTHHSRMLCARGDLDHCEGILFVKDYYKALSEKRNFALTDLVAQAAVVPENADASQVLDLLRTHETHVCFVLNEYGGFEGLITMHDIMESIVGDVPDEGEAYEPNVFVREDKSVLVSGDAPVETLSEVIEGLSFDFETIDYSTVAGFVFELINKIPQLGDKVDYLDYTIEIVDLDGNRIDKILIYKNEITNEESED